jgi:hypothetical protein
MISQKTNNNTMKPKEYIVLSDAVERGVEYGWNRAYKHTEDPDPREIRQSIIEQVMITIGEYFEFDDVDV